MKHELVLLGKTKNRFVEDGITEYLDRLRHYTSFTTVLRKEKGRIREPDPKAEGKQLLANISPGWQVVALDPRGKSYSSPQFATLIENWERSGIRGVRYLIGGPLGLSDEVRQRADLLLSLSAMTFTHDMTRLLLVEQIYRAYTIKAGEKYHK